MGEKSKAEDSRSQAEPEARGLGRAWVLGTTAEAAALVWKGGLGSLVLLGVVLLASVVAALVFRTHPGVPGALLVGGGLHLVCVACAWVGAAYFQRVHEAEGEASLGEAARVVGGHLGALAATAGAAFAVGCAGAGVAGALVVVLAEGGAGSGLVLSATMIGALAVADTGLRLTLFAPHAVLHDERGPFEALAESWRLTAKPGGGLGALFEPYAALLVVAVVLAMVLPRSPGAGKGLLVVGLAAAFVLGHALWSCERRARLRLAELGKLGQGGVSPLELGIVAVICSGLAYLAVPNHHHGPGARYQRACISEMQAIEGAIEMAVLDEVWDAPRLDPGALEELKSHGYIQTIPIHRGASEVGFPYRWLPEEVGSVRKSRMVCLRHGTRAYEEEGWNPDPVGQLEALGVEDPALLAEVAAAQPTSRPRRLARLRRRAKDGAALALGAGLTLVHPFPMPLHLVSALQ